MKRSFLLATAAGAVFLFGLGAGCTPGAREDLDQAGENVGQATSKSVEGTAEATANAGQAVAQGAEKAADATGQAVENAGQAVAQGAEKAADATGRAVENVAEGAAEATQSATLTPKVKNALLADKQIAGRNLDVTTNTDNNTVTITGTAGTSALKSRITAVAQKAAGANIKIVNNVTVGGAK